MMIGFAGKAGAGKSNAARHVAVRFGLQRRSFADPLKEAAMVMFALDAKQVFTQRGKAEIDPRWGMTPRQILQQLGAYGRSIRPDFWIQRAFLNPAQRGVVFDDVRFQNEVNSIQDRGGLVLKIDRPGLTNDDPDPSENQQLFVDYTIHNDGSLQDLTFAIDAILAAEGVTKVSIAETLSFGGR